ncbi:MAG: hypothetical protein HYT67_00035 [Candidatus Yanofskybacteria bacterium]|nr:hypothetical protein [Candidatus Yanofskybacteria bacterium]
MDLVINFVDIGKIRLELKQGRRVEDTLDFSFHGNLDDLLISSVDKVLKENRIEALSLKTVSIGGDVDKNSSAYKIALAFIKAWKEAKKL